MNLITLSGNKSVLCPRGRNGFCLSKRFTNILGKLVQGKESQWLCSEVMQKSKKPTENCLLTLVYTHNILMAWVKGNFKRGNWRKSSEYKLQLSFSHSLVKLISIEYLLWTRYWSKLWWYSSEQNNMSAFWKFTCIHLCTHTCYNLALNKRKIRTEQWTRKILYYRKLG